MNVVLLPLTKQIRRGINILIIYLWKISKQEGIFQIIKQFSLTFEKTQYIFNIAFALSNMNKKCYNFEEFIDMFTSSVEEHLKNYNTIKTIESQLRKVHSKRYEYVIKGKFILYSFAIQG